jgi:hypothetical protein
MLSQRDLIIRRFILSQTRQHTFADSVLAPPFDLDLLLIMSSGPTWGIGNACQIRIGQATDSMPAVQDVSTSAAAHEAACRCCGVAGATFTVAIFKLYADARLILAADQCLDLAPTTSPRRALVSLPTSNTPRASTCCYGCPFRRQVQTLATQHVVIRCHCRFDIGFDRHIPACCC